MTSPKTTNPKTTMLPTTLDAALAFDAAEQSEAEAEHDDGLTAEQRIARQIEDDRAASSNGHGVTRRGRRKPSDGATVN